MKKLLALLLGALALSGCETMEKISSKIPDGEYCLIVKGRKVCAVKRDGKWSYSADLSAEERAEAEGLTRE